MITKQTKTALSMLAIACFAPYAAGCQVGAMSDEAQIDDEQITVRVSGPDGTVEEMTGTFEEVMGPSLGMLPEFSLDGELSIDAAGLVSGERAEFELVTGETLVLERSGNTIERLVNPEHGEELAATVQWNDTLDTLWVELPSGATVISVEGLEDEELRARYIGYMAAMSLGADMTRTADGGQAELAPVVVVGLAALGVVGYIACLTGGSSACRDAAELGCGAGNVSEYKVVCGAGTDVSGSFQLGYHCSYICD